ncbi:unnamed protein product [Schistosoma margrebowiei]|uniref:Uncharacterized protein n=1 Tax=Schistosoma margrebowiei TaxID=48269 RepID=A0A183MXI7_9TREM|nr:unnamed protein product [Schistosoma margrebowiei]
MLSLWTIELTSTVNNSQRSSSKLNVVLNDDVGDNNNNAQSITLSHNSKSNSLDIDNNNNKVEINHHCQHSNRPDEKCS